MGHISRWVGGAALAVVLSLAAIVATLRRRTGDRVREIPLFWGFASGRVGADWAERNGYAGQPAAGEVEDFHAFARSDFDPAVVDPEIRRFYEETADYEMGYTVEWHRGFRTGARVAGIATSRLEQLNLPGRSNDGVRRLESTLTHVPADADPRECVVWTRTDPERDAAVFVATYGTHAFEGATYANVAVPLPWSNLSTVLRPEPIDLPGETDGVAFTTRGPGDGGLYLVTPVGPVALPVAQSFRVWPADAAGAIDSPIADADLVATHEMWLRGRQFLTIRYGIRPAAENDEDR